MHYVHIACVLNSQTSGGNFFPGCSGGMHAAYFSRSTTYTAPTSRTKGEDSFYDRIQEMAANSFRGIKRQHSAYFSGNTTYIMHVWIVSWILR